MSDDDIFQKICADIDALMPPKNLKHEAFDRALASIDAAITRGVQVEEFSKVFAKYGIEIAPSTVRQYRKTRRPDQNVEETGQRKPKRRKKGSKKGSPRAKRKDVRSHSSAAAPQTEVPASADGSAEPRHSQSGKIHKVF